MGSTEEIGKEQQDGHPAQTDTEPGATDATSTSGSSAAPATAAPPAASTETVTETETNAVPTPELTNEAGDAGDSAVPVTDAPITSEQDRIDAILQKLFFSPKNQLISEGTVYDPSVR